MGKSESENEDKGFKVTDRRSFTSDGRPREEAEESSRRPEPVSEPPKSAPEPRAEKKSPEAAGPWAGGTPQVEFLDLVHMLATNALVQLGDVADPTSEERVENLQGAQVMIALLAMLQEKTKGNLGKDETNALEDVLYDLRMRFVAKASPVKS